MLILASRIQTEAAKLGTAAGAIHCIESRLIGTPVIVGDCLTQMEAVAECQATNPLQPDVCPFASIRKPFGVILLGSELALQQRQVLASHGVLRYVAIDVDLFKHVLYAATGPGAQSEKARIQIAQTMEPFQCRIHPAVHRDVNVGGAGVVRTSPTANRCTRRATEQQQRDGAD